MRITLAIDDDVLAAAKRRAEQERRTVDEVISSLARDALSASGWWPYAERNGIPLLPTRAGVPPVTLEMTNQLREDQR